MIPTLQIIAGLSWLIAAIFYSKSVWRVLASRAKWIDVFRALFVFVALTQVGFTVRWLVWPHAIGQMGFYEQLTWAILYTMSAILGAALVVASYFFERLRGSK